MNLKFLGRGGSDNQLQGNNSAYFIEDRSLFLIDCGENIFEKILEKEILKEIDRIYLFITHTHSDHVGSIGSLLFHCYFSKKIELNLVIPSDALHLKDIKELLRIYGCYEDWYKIIDPNELDNKFSSFNTIRYMRTKHVIYIPAYGILFDTNDGLVYYSGDSSEINNIKKLLKSNQKIDKIYLDVTTSNIDESNEEQHVHYFIGKANEEIDYSLRNKFYCMHFNNNKCIEKAKEYGFNVVKLIDTQ